MRRMARRIGVLLSLAARRQTAQTQSTPSREGLNGPLIRSAGACPSRTLGKIEHGGGQAPALRYEEDVGMERACPSRAFNCLKQDGQDNRSLAVVSSALTNRADPINTVKSESGDSELRSGEN